MRKNITERKIIHRASHFSEWQTWPLFTYMYVYRNILQMFASYVTAAENVSKNMALRSAYVIALWLSHYILCTANFARRGWFNYVGSLASRHFPWILHTYKITWAPSRKRLICERSMGRHGDGFADVFATKVHATFYSRSRWVSFMNFFFFCCINFPREKFCGKKHRDTPTNYKPPVFRFYLWV